MGLSSIVGRILPAATAYVTSGGNPLAAAASYAAADKARDEKKRIRMENAKFLEERQNMAYYDQRGGGFTDTSMMAGSSASPGFFDRLGSAAGRIGESLLTGFETALPSFINRQIGGISRPQQAVQQPALTTKTNVGAQESQGSGSIEAGAANLLAPLLQAGRSLLKSPGGQLAIGTGTGLAFSGFGSAPSGMRMTRKMKSQARTVLNMTGGNLSATADILGINENMLVMLLLKRFRNDGPVVTKAALRKTKKTIRRLHSMQDVLKSITPTATMRRRTPMKRASTTTLIKN